MPPQQSAPFGFFWPKKKPRLHYLSMVVPLDNQKQKTREKFISPSEKKSKKWGVSWKMVGFPPFFTPPSADHFSDRKTPWVLLGTVPPF